MNDPLQIAYLAGGFTLLGALIGLLGTIWVARHNTKKAKELAEHNDLLERRREFDKEDREHKWAMQKLTAERQAKPLLKLIFDRKNSSCIFPYQYSVPSKPSGVQLPFVQGTQSITKTDWYISILVKNDGGGPAKNCVGQLKVLEQIANGQSNSVPIHGPLRLVWSHDPADVTLERDTDRPLNVFIARDKTQPLDVRLKDGLPTAVDAACKQMGEFIFTIMVSADDADPQEIRLHVLWDGTWNGTWGEDRIWIE